MTIDYSGYFWKNSLIRLRRPQPGDWEFLIHHMFDSLGRFYFNSEIDMPVDIEEYKQQNQFTAPDKLNYVPFAIVNNEDRHVGILNVFGIDERNGNFGPVGILINPAERGHGYALAAMRLMGHYMFGERRMYKWNSDYLEVNDASAALHKKLGFEIEGRRRDLFYHEGHYWNLISVGMTEEQFYENEKKLPPL